MVPLDSGFLFFKLVELDSNESPILEGIFLAFILENDTLEEYVKVRKKASYIRKKLRSLFLKKLCLEKRENENDEYYDY
ncbi:hypothetical protein DW738_00905 [Streptococcus sp. AM28-20]|nr:hypothetical protein DW738_00905 [Streptococcus sp. AM28-20]